LGLRVAKVFRGFSISWSPRRSQSSGLSPGRAITPPLDDNNAGAHGERLEGVGVMPTIEVQASAGSDDPQLNRAVAALSGTW